MVTVSRIAAPTINLQGTRIFEDGSRFSTNLNVNQNIPQGTPSSVTNIPVYNFVDQVTITLSAPSGVNLKDYSSAPAEDDNNVTGLAEGTQETGNILYFLGTRMPSPSEAEIYTGPFKIVQPGVSFSGKGYAPEGDVITLFAAVFVRGEVGIEAVAQIKVS